MTMGKGLIRPYSFLLIQFNRVIDTASIFLGLFLAIKSSAWDLETSLLALLASLIFALSAESRHLYRSWRVAPLHEELSMICGSWFSTALIMVAVIYLLDDTFHLGRASVIIWMMSTPVMLGAIRIIARLVLRSGRLAGRNFRFAAIAGVNKMGRRIAERLIFNRWMGIRLIGYFDDRSPERVQTVGGRPVPLLGNIDELAKRVRAGEIDIIYITLPMRAEIRVQGLIEKLADTPIQIYYVADFSVFDLLHAQWETLGDIPILRAIDTPFHGINSIAKRIQDLCCGSFLILLCGVPMLAIAIAIKLSSPGPVIYRQLRHGLDGHEFIIYKFRTMYVRVPEQTYQQATRDDPRVTAVGRFLRRTSLDELPQIINVLQGRMSLVGPRPHPLELDDQHRQLIKYFSLRHKVRPGITGWAQVNGYRGETETLDKMERRLEYDLEYINNWSIWLDMRILLLTLVRMWKDRNAY